MVPSRAFIESVRRFNRFYTRRIGVLQQGLLDSSYSLTEVRVLYELAHRPDVTAGELGTSLGLDAGYLSRILARFLKRRLLLRRRSKDDARQMHLRLTAEGRKTFAELDALSSAQVAEMTAHLSAPGRRQLEDSLRSAEFLLRAPDAPRGRISLRGPRAGDLGWVVQRHGALYAQEYGWDATFEALVASIVGEFGSQPASEGHRCWIAEWEGEPVGCIFLVRENAAVGKLRLLLVEPSARGCGLGRKLIEECIRQARVAGYRKLTLWTNSVLHAARHLYERAGFRLVKSESHRSFGHELTGQYWELALV